MAYLLAQERGKLAYLKNALLLNLRSWTGAPLRSLATLATVVVIMGFAGCLTGLALVLGVELLGLSSAANSLGEVVSFVGALGVTMGTGVYAARSMHRRRLLHPEPEVAAAAVQCLELLSPYLDPEQEGKLLVSGDDLTLTLPMQSGGEVECSLDTGIDGIPFKAAHKRYGEAEELELRVTLLPRGEGRVALLEAVTSLSALDVEDALEDLAARLRAQKLPMRQRGQAHQGALWLRSGAPRPEEVDLESPREVALEEEGDASVQLWGARRLWFIWQMGVYLVASQLMSLLLLASVWFSFEDGFWFQGLYQAALLGTWEWVVWRLAPPRWHLRFFGRGQARQRPHLLLRGAVLSHSLAPERTIDLKRPFALHLTQAPEPEPDGRRLLQLELSQGDGVQRRKLRLGFLAHDTPQLEALPRMAQVAPLCSSQALQAWIWPAITYAASLHGEPPRWSLGAQEGAPSIQQEVRQEQRAEVGQR